MNKDVITVTEYTKQLSQEEDCCGRSGQEYQYLNLKTMDNGVGHYLVFDTERWAVDDRDDWIKLWDTHIEPMLKEVNKHLKEESLDELTKQAQDLKMGY